MLELERHQHFEPASDAEFFRALPQKPGVLLIEMKEPAAQPYLIRTSDIRRAAERLLSAPEVSAKRLNLRDVATQVYYRACASRFEQMLVHYQQARAHFPRRYHDVVRLRPPAMLKVNLRNAYPRCYITRRVQADEGFYFGPFVSRRAAEPFVEGFLDLFKVRRCKIKIRPDPGFPGCIYSEMKMCLAPCFAGCTKQEYEAEVGSVLITLATHGAALTREIESQRGAASEVLDFERAAALHKRLEKVSSALHGLPEIAKRIEDLNAVILQRSVKTKTIAAFPIRAGMIAEPIILPFDELSSEPRSVEAILRSGLESPPQKTTQKKGAAPSSFEVADQAQTNPLPQATAGNIEHLAGDQRRRFGLHSALPELGEHLSLIARWFYSNPREGEIFFPGGDWPYRRILRACGRLLALAAQEETADPSAAKQSAQAKRDRIKRLNAFSRRPKPPRS